MYFKKIVSSLSQVTYDLRLIQGMDANGDKTKHSLNHLRVRRLICDQCSNTLILAYTVVSKSIIIRENLSGLPRNKSIDKTEKESIIFFR